jgi:tetratricopeptide (TPR) repeat protein
MPEDPAVPPLSERSTLDQTGASSAGSFGRYRLLQRLGEGGMGEVWLAEQMEPVRRQVALKVIKAGMDSTQVVARFEAERQALALMDHPVIATVFDGGTTPQGRPYFAMEYVKGEPITTYCDRHLLSTGERLGLFMQVCEGIQHAHQKGIIHRDLKPSNVLVTIQDDRPVPKIIDFGVAKATAQHLTERSLFTELGVLIGTPEYMSPEQAEMGGLDIDTRTDIYALGTLLYELLTGALPFDRKDLRQAGLAEIQRIIREKEPPRPSTRITQLGPASTEAAKNRHTEPRWLMSELRGDLDWITMRALEKDRTRRYQTANALAADVRRHLNNEPVSAGPPTAAYRAGKFVRRHRFGVAAAATLVLLLLAFGVTRALQAQRIGRERDRANREAEAGKQVSDFLVGLFQVSDPSEARGRTLTAAEILSNGAARVKDTLRDQPEIQARLMATIGGVYTKLGLFKEAEPLLKQALDTYTRVAGPDHPDRLTALNRLADVYWYQSQFTLAEPLYRELVQRTERGFGREHRRTLKAKWDLASLCIVDHRSEEAERLMREVLETQRRVLGEDDSDTVNTMNNLQALYYSQKRYADALPIGERVLEVSRRSQGEDHPDVLQHAHNLATVYDALGRQGEAESLLLATIATKRRVLGDSHPDTCLSLDALGSLYRRAGRYGEAEPLLLSAYDGYARTFSPEHPDTLGEVSELARLYDAWGKPEKARKWRAKLESANSAAAQVKK